MILSELKKEIERLEKEGAMGSLLVVDDNEVNWTIAKLKLGTIPQHVHPTHEMRQPVILVCYDEYNWMDYADELFDDCKEADNG